MRAPISSTLRWLVLLGLLLASLLASRSLAGQEGGEAAPNESVVAGALSYRIYCASCHGEKADGHGPVAAVLRIPPPDLTQLALRHGGEMSAARVEQAIDGREQILAHGRSEMPVWGLAFREPGRSAEEEAAVLQKIRDLVAYLRTLQVAEARED